MPLQPVHTTPRRGWFQRSVWLLDGYGRIPTLVSLVGTAVGVAVIVTAAVHQVSKWTLPWLVMLGIGVGLLVAVTVMLALANWLGGRIIASHTANACWVTNKNMPEGQVVIVGNPLTLTNTDPDWEVLPMRVRLRSVRVDGQRQHLSAEDREGYLAQALPPPTLAKMTPGTSLPYSVSFIVSIPGNPSVVSAKLDVQDQFLRWSRGRRVRFQKPVEPAVIVALANSGPGRSSS